MITGILRKPDVSLWTLFFGTVLILISFLGCSETRAREKIIKIAGSSTVLPIATRAAEKFMELYPAVQIIVSPGGSGVGISSLGSGLIDIGMVSRNLSDEERSRFPKLNFHTQVVARDAVSTVISLEIYNSGVHVLSKEDVQKIYSGEIDNWNEVGGPDRKIVCIDKESHRGTRHVFMKFLFGDPRAPAAGADIITGSNNEELTKISLSNSAIGILSMAWINNKVKQVGLKVEGKILLPSVENIKKGTYPLSRNLTFLTHGKPKGTVEKFIQFVLSTQGQKIVENSGYVPIL